MVEDGGRELMQKKRKWKSHFGVRKILCNLHISCQDTWNCVLKMDAFDLCKLHFGGWFVCFVLFFNMEVILESGEGSQWFFGFVFM